VAKKTRPWQYIKRKRKALALNPPEPVRRWLVEARAKYHAWLEGVGGKAKSYAVSVFKGSPGHSQEIGQSAFASRKTAEDFMAAKRSEGLLTVLWMATQTDKGIEQVQYPSLLNSLFFSALVTPPKEVLMATVNPCGGRTMKKNPAEVDRIIAYEQGELSPADTIRLFASLIKSGTVWQLQGHYGRTAKQLIMQGYISTKGVVLKQVADENPAKPNPLLMVVPNPSRESLARKILKGWKLVTKGCRIEVTDEGDVFLHYPGGSHPMSFKKLVPSLRGNPGGKQLYVGIKTGLEPPGELFWSTFKPTFARPGMAMGYDYVIGPFRTKFGAELMAQFGGQGNPHYQHVEDAEAYAKAYRKRGLTTVVQVLRSPSPHANPSKARANPMKVHKELFARWHKYVHLFLAEHNAKLSDVTTPVVAWNIAFKLDIPREAYHVGLNDSHIETALRKLFPFAWARKNPGDLSSGRWWVVAGSHSWWFNDESAAKREARKWMGGRVFEVVGKYKFLRWCSDDKGRMVKANPGSLVEAEALRRADAARDAKQAGLHSRYMKAIDADDRAEMARIGAERASVGGAPQSRRVKMIRIKPGQWGEAVMPYSEVNMHMRIAGKWMRFQLLKGKYPMVQLYREDGGQFSAPITTGEAGIMEDSRGFYYRPYTTPLSNPGRAYHRREAKRYSGLLASDIKAKHKSAKDYWQGALSAEAAAVAAGKVVKNPGDDMGSLSKHPDFQKAVALYRKFHGCEPKSFKRVLLPVGDKRKVESRGFFVSLGKAPAESYTPPGRSQKAGSTYVHKYDSAPEKVVSADGKLVATLPGRHRVTDWIRG